MLKIILFFIICMIICYFIQPSKLNKSFYDANEIYPEFNAIHELRPQILTELSNATNWHDWPEKQLYDNKGDWKIYPFYAFGIWVDNNCKRMPTLTKFIKSIPNVKLATLSKLSPKMKLTQHRGWGSHSNGVLRAHYCLSAVDNKCYVSVTSKNKTERRFHKNGEWIVFDDSKKHMAENMSDKERIILIVDIERPSHVAKGTSKVGDTKELLDIINYFKNT